jgi:NAD+ synthase
MAMTFNKEILSIDPESEVQKISDFIREMAVKNFKSRGAVVGLSGGIDSAVVAELCVHALGKERVLGLLLPEIESNPISLKYGKMQAEKMGVKTITVDITQNLESLGVYEERNSVIKRIFPEFDESFKFHITLPQNLLEKDRLNYHTIIIEDGNGSRQAKRISATDWLKISSCQNIKQRTRMIQLFHYAERKNYLVAGTTNKTEVMQGFFVKFGDGGVDIEPLAHLYKTQVYSLARHLGVIMEIIERPPSPDTYSLPVTDKEFYFCMDFSLLDLLLCAYEKDVSLDTVSKTLDLKEKQIQRAFRDFTAKERATWHLREMPPSLEVGVEHRERQKAKG